MWLFFASCSKLLHSSKLPSREKGCLSLPSSSTAEGATMLSSSDNHINAGYRPAMDVPMADQQKPQKPTKAPSEFIARKIMIVFKTCRC
jgi:hypothetical protein